MEGQERCHTECLVSHLRSNEDRGNQQKETWWGKGIRDLWLLSISLVMRRNKEAGEQV